MALPSVCLTARRLVGELHLRGHSLLELFSVLTNMAQSDGAELVLVVSP